MINGCFITGTSPGVLAVKQINNQILPPIPEIVREISTRYENLVDGCISNWIAEE